MRAPDVSRADVGVQSFSLVKRNEGEEHPFEIVEGGDDLMTTTTQLDALGRPRTQVRTYEPEELR